MATKTRSFQLSEFSWQTFEAMSLTLDDCRKNNTRGAPDEKLVYPRKECERCLKPDFRELRLAKPRRKNAAHLE